MDVEAVSYASNDFLQELGLETKGDLFALKAFCRVSTSRHGQAGYSDYEERKRKLLEELQKGKQNKRFKSDNASCTTTKRTALGGQSKTRKVSLGWLHFSSKQGRFIAVRLNNGGGTRKLDVASDSSKEAIIREGKELFFPNNESTQGHADDMIFDLANFQGVAINNVLEDGNKTEPFTIQRYIEKNKLTQIRLYLTSKPTPVVVSDGENSVPHPDDDSCKIVKTIDDRESEDEDLLNSIFDTEETTGGTADVKESRIPLIGTSEDRCKLREEQDQLFQQALNDDRQKEEEKREAEEKKEKENREAKEKEDKENKRLEAV